MKETYRSPTPGKMEEHAEGLGVPSPEQVEERARELAKIAGRAGRVRDDDRDQARRELTGHAVPTTDPIETEEEAEPASLWEETTGTPGKEIVTHGPEDETLYDEELIKEGMDEALHDEMLEARKKNIDEAS
jgi:hypothetical protein